MNQPLIFNVQKFCVHDGPGIRTTVFFKGCPLQCHWCHNPESQNFHPELLCDAEKCTGCGHCQSECPQQAIRFEKGVPIINRSRCNACGKCADICLCGAREIAGKTMCITELLQEIEKDQIFYEQSGGGVTFSGGEALCQIDALEQLARACKLRGIHVAVDTSGHVPFTHFERILDYTDLFLYDLKHMDMAAHQQYTGQSNQLALDNLRRLSAAHANIYLRLPLIKDVNDDDQHIRAVLECIKDMRITQVNLLPYHNTGSSKHLRLGRSYDLSLFAAPSPERLNQICALFADTGLTVHIGG